MLYATVAQGTDSLIHYFKPMHSKVSDDTKQIHAFIFHLVIQNACDHYFLLTCSLISHYNNIAERGEWGIGRRRSKVDIVITIVKQKLHW